MQSDDSTRLSPEFGRWLQRQLDRREWTQADFARKVNLSTGTVNHWITAKRIPDPPSCDRIADALFLDVQDVLRHAGHLSETPDDSEHVRELIAMIRRVDWTPERLRFVSNVLRDLVDRKPNDY
jgi:transcriptional regulator with XRE-family HTH domain